MACRCFLWPGGSGFWSFVSSFFFLPSVATAGKYSVWSVEGLLGTFGVGGQQADALVAEASVLAGV
jgi:hypothetical protein